MSISAAWRRPKLVGCRDGQISGDLVGAAGDGGQSADQDEAATRCVRKGLFCVRLPSPLRL
jgi:hypothetical protein